jgi:hypothetical protein
MIETSPEILAITVNLRVAGIPRIGRHGRRGYGDPS